MEALPFTCRSLRMRRCFHLVLLLLSACSARAEAQGKESPTAKVVESAPAPKPITKPEPPKPAVKPPTYAWLDGKVPGSTLLERFPAPLGSKRVEVAPGSFGHFLRTLPLLPAGTPVRSFAGGVIHAGDHANVAAVADLDVGTHDLQQCADSVLRLHAEWRWSQGKTDAHYKTGSGLVLAFDRYLAGERLHVANGDVKLVTSAAKKPASHALYRTWLDDVFGWANTGSLAKEATPVAVADLAPGDFFVMPGSPFGHAVLVLDAVEAQGQKRVLLGQGFMPAQSFHVLADGGPWFTVDVAAGSMKTPFWKPFPFSSLRRLP